MRSSFLLLPFLPFFVFLSRRSIITLSDRQNCDLRVDDCPQILVIWFKKKRRDWWIDEIIQTLCQEWRVSHEVQDRRFWQSKHLVTFPHSQSANKADSPSLCPSLMDTIPSLCDKSVFSATKRSLVSSLLHKSKRPFYSNVPSFRVELKGFLLAVIHPSSSFLAPKRKLWFSFLTSQLSKLHLQNHFICIE